MVVSLFAKVTVTLFMGLFLTFLLLVGMAPDLLALHLIWGLTWGQGFVLAIHLLPVVAAWVYLNRQV